MTGFDVDSMRARHDEMRSAQDPHRVIPRGAYGVVQPVGMAIRYLLEYDVAYMQDRLRADLFINGRPAGVYAVAALGDDFIRYSYGSGSSGQMAAEEAVRRYGADLERLVLDEFMGLGYRRRLATLEGKVAALTEHITRVRWWHLRRRWAARKAAQQ